MAKTLVFNFDGTGNEPSDAGEFAQDESISNVLKLHVLMGGGLESGEIGVETPDGEEQRAFYYNGIGTREGKLRIPLLGRLYSSGRSLVNMAFAPRWGDAARILREAKDDFGEAYEDGDSVAVFGFSRGAALARKFVAMILREDAAREVAFLGVFDTVAAMDGMHRKGEKTSTDVVFENGTLHEHGGLIAKVGDQAPRRVCVNDNDRPSAPQAAIVLLQFAGPRHPPRRGLFCTGCVRAKKAARRTVQLANFSRRRRANRSRRAR